MVITWQKVALFLAVVGVGVWAYFRFFASAGESLTAELPAAYAQGNPLALAELKKRPYDRNLSPLFRRIVTDSGEPKVREAALCYIARGRESAEEGVIVSALCDPNSEVRKAACAAAAGRKLKQAVEVLMPLLEDEDVNVQGAAQKALQEITGIHRYMGRSEWEQRWNMRDLLE